MRLLPGLVASLSLPEASVLLPSASGRVFPLAQVKLPVPQPLPEPLDPRQPLVEGSLLYERQRQSAEERSWDSPS
jgi:hypothetical protein